MLFTNPSPGGSASRFTAHHGDGARRDVPWVFRVGSVDQLDTFNKPCATAHRNLFVLAEKKIVSRQAMRRVFLRNEDVPGELHSEGVCGSGSGGASRGGNSIGSRGPVDKPRHMVTAPTRLPVEPHAGHGSGSSAGRVADSKRTVPHFAQRTTGIAMSTMSGR